MNSRSKSLFLALAFVLTLVLFPIWALWPSTTTLQVLRTPDGVHEIKLSRTDSIDRNYHLWVDGQRVYWSPDFAPRRNLPFREALILDTSENIVILEIARHRVAGYDIAAKRLLADDELLGVEAAPDPPLSEYFFEGTWPGVGRARQ